jgi:hypothetical protein
MWAPVALLLFASCVTLTPPWDQTADAQHDAGPGLDGTATGGATGGIGSGGVSGGSDAIPQIDSPAKGGAGGAIDGPAAVFDGPTAGGTTGSIDSPLVGTEAGNLPGIDGKVVDGTGGAGGTGIDSPIGGADGARRDGLDADIGGRDGAGTGGSATGGSGTGGATGTGGSSTGGATGTGGSGTGGATGTGGAGGVSAVGLVAYYPCDQTAGPTLSDLSGNGRNATLVTGTGGSGGYTFAKGKVNNALNLVKANQGYASIATSGLSGATEMTIATWVYLNTSTNWQRIWDFGTSSTSAYMFVATTNNQSNVVRFTVSLSGNTTGAEQTVDGKAPLPTGTWTHVAVVLGSAGAVLYVDGAQVGTNPAVTLRPNDLGNTPNNYIGKSQFPADPYLDGNIDEFRVYSRALSAAEIQALYTYTGT